MTVQELFDYQDGIYPNQYTKAEKVVWLNDVEQQIYNFLIQFDKDIELPIYEATSEDELLINEPDIYALYISAISDFANGEYARYNNKVMLYQAKLEDWKSAYLRANKPLKMGHWKNI